MATAGEDRRETDSGIEVKPVYTAEDVAGLELEPPGEFPFTRGPYRGHVPGPAVDDPPVRGLRVGGGVERALPVPARARPDGALGGVRPADPARLRLGRPARARRGGAHGVAIDSLADMEMLLSGIPLDEVSTSMTINAPAALLLLLYELSPSSRACRRTAARNRPERHPQGVHRPRELHLPPRPSMRLTTDLFAYCRERLPRWNTISISGYHIREAGSTAAQELAFTLANGIAYCEAAVSRGPVPGRVRRPALVLLQRSQPLLPRGGEISRGEAALGAASCATASP